MVQQEVNNHYSTKSSMGPGAVCGATLPLTDSQPSSPSMESNGGYSSTPSGRTASDVQSTLSSLVGVAGVSQDELISKLRSVVNQNLELKESLAQNNLALRHQLSLVVRWSQQQQHHKQQQQQQLDALGRHVTALQHDNEALRAGKEFPAGSCREQARLQERLQASLQQAGLLQEDKDKLAALRAKLEADVTLLKCDLTTSRGDQERLQLERCHLLATNTELKNQLRIHHLSQQQQKGGGGSDCAMRRERDASASLRAECDQLQCDLQRSNTKLAAMDATAAAAQQGVGSNMELCKLEEEATLLKEDVELLERTLGSERVRLAEERRVVAHTAAEMATLRADLDAARDNIHRNTNTDHYYQTKIKTMNEQHDAVTAKLLSYEELLSAKNEELSKLKRESGQAKARLSEMQSEGETIAILRAQVEVYQGDFRAEREAREALASEREQLRDEVRQLQARNTQLMDEMQPLPQHRVSRAGSAEPQASLLTVSGGAAAQHSALMDHLSQHLDNKENEGTPDAPTAAAVVDESLFYCPKCNKSFTELRPLETHVNKCLDED